MSEGAPPIALVPAAKRELDDAQREAVDLLERMLERARRGDFIAAIVALESADLTFEVAYTPSMDALRRMGMLEWVKSDWIEGINRGRR